MNRPLEVGDILIAEYYCGFPDGTTKGKEYEVVSVKVFPTGYTLFHIINDEGEYVLPISTSFKRKEANECHNDVS